MEIHNIFMWYHDKTTCKKPSLLALNQACSLFPFIYTSYIFPGLLLFGHHKWEAMHFSQTCAKNTSCIQRGMLCSHMMNDINSASLNSALALCFFLPLLLGLLWHSSLLSSQQQEPARPRISQASPIEHNYCLSLATATFAPQWARFIAAALTGWRPSFTVSHQDNTWG